LTDIYEISYERLRIANYPNGLPFTFLQSFTFANNTDFLFDCNKKRRCKVAT